jgi:hypothetical protein
VISTSFLLSPDGAELLLLGDFGVQASSVLLGMTLVVNTPPIRRSQRSAGDLFSISALKSLPQNCFITASPNELHLLVNTVVLYILQ